MHWLDSIDDTVRGLISCRSLKPINLDRYLRLSYDQDDSQLLDIQDDDFPIKECEKAMRKITDEELDSLSDVLRKLITYHPASRGSPETLLRSPWFKGRTGLWH